MDSNKGRKDTEDGKNSDDTGNSVKRMKKISERMFSPVDRQLLKECEINSLLYSCLPLMGLYSVGYRAFMIRKGRNPTFLGYLFMSGFGYFMGRLLYFPFCQKKIANSPSMSPFAQLTREMLGYPQRENSQPKKKQKSFSLFGEETKDDDQKDDKRDNEVTYGELRKQNRSKDKSE